MLPEIITDPNVLDTIFAVRWRVLTEIGMPEEIYPNRIVRDPHDKFGTHLALIDGDTIRAAARTSIHQHASQLPSPHYFAAASKLLEPPIASMNRLIVVPKFRSNGHARLLDEQRIAFAREHGCKSIVIYIHRFSGARRLTAVKELGFMPLYHGQLTKDPIWGGDGNALHMEI